MMCVCVFLFLKIVSHINNCECETVASIGGHWTLSTQPGSSMTPQERVLLLSYLNFLIFLTMTPIELSLCLNETSMTI